MRKINQYRFRIVSGLGFGRSHAANLTYRDTRDEAEAECKKLRSECYFARFEMIDDSGVPVRQETASVEFAVGS